MFGSPGTPGLGDKWAFGYERCVGDPNYVPRQKEQEVPAKEENEIETTDNIWSSIPLDTDILITHTPPYGHCDLGIVRGSDGSDGGPSTETSAEESDKDADRRLGCYALLQRLSIVRPRLHICGHVHRARGAERIRWSPPAPCPETSCPDNRENDGFKQMTWTISATEKWTDPNPDSKSAKISLVDLTGRSRGEGSSKKLDWNDDDKDSMGEARRETCVVNCAILASNYPHVGGKKFHKPVVVDLELPVCDEEGQDDQ